MNILLNLAVLLCLFVGLLVLIITELDCSSYHLLLTPSKCKDGRIHDWRNRNISHIDSSTKFTSTERDSPSTSVAPQQQPKNSSQSLIHVFSSYNKSSIGSLPTPNTVRIFELVVNGSGEYDYLDEFLASHQFFEMIMVSLRSKHPSQNSNNSFDENDSSGSSSSVPPTFKLSDEKKEQVSRTEENRTSELFNCSDISLDVTDQDDIQMKNLKLKIKHLSRPGVTFTVCRIVKEEKVTQTYPIKLGIMMSIVTYSSVSLHCAWVFFIISVPEFAILYIVLNIITYFLICMMVTGSITGVILYFLPFHLNFMFILVTLWITLMSCKVVYRQLKKFNFFRIANVNVARMCLVTMAISLLMLLLTPDTIQEMTSFALGNNYILEQEVHSKWMSSFNPYILFVYDLVSATLFYRLYQREKLKELKEIKNPVGYHTDHYEMYYIYNMFSIVFWFFGFLVITFLSAFPQFWYLYLLVSVLLPFFFFKSCMETHTEKVTKVHVTGNGKPETIRQV